MFPKPYRIRRRIKFPFQRLVDRIIAYAESQDRVRVSALQQILSYYIDDEHDLQRGTKSSDENYVESVRRKKCSYKTPPLFLRGVPTLEITEPLWAERGTFWPRKRRRGVHEGFRGRHYPSRSWGLHRSPRNLMGHNLIQYDSADNRRLPQRLKSVPSFKVPFPGGTGHQSGCKQLRFLHDFSPRKILKIWPYTE